MRYQRILDVGTVMELMKRLSEAEARELGAYCDARVDRRLPEREQAAVFIAVCSEWLIRWRASRQWLN